MRIKKVRLYMKISEIISKVKKYHYGSIHGKKIEEKTTRDKVLLGNPNVECTGIVTTCWANMDVIHKTIECGANLIICHEALFWNHGDHTEWLEKEKNDAFLKKKKLLEKYGLPLEDGSYVDGIFYGLAKVLDWVPYINDNISDFIQDSEGWDAFKDHAKLNPLSYIIPETTVEKLAQYLIQKLNLNGVKVIGNKNQKVSKISIPFHVFGDANYAIRLANEKKVDCFLTMELVDFTLAEYVRDASCANNSVSIIGMGHFNIEEPGMKYMVEYLPKVIGENISCQFIQSGDNYSYITR